jgi:predicted ATPase
MYLVSLEVKGLKSLRDTKIEGLDHYNVFIGKNDSGKSTLLESVGLLREVAGQLDARRLAESLTDKLPLGRVDVSLTVQLSDADLDQLPPDTDTRAHQVMERFRVWRYDLYVPIQVDSVQTYFWVEACGFFSGETYTKVVDCIPTRGEWWVLNNDGLQEVLSRADGAPDGARPAGPPVSSLRIKQAPYVRDMQIWPPDAPYLGILRGLKTCISELEAVRSAPDEMPVSATRRLEPSGGNLAQVIETLESAYPDDFDEVQTLVRQLFPDVKAIYTPTEGTNKVVRVSGGEELQPLKSYRLSNVGAGVQQALMVATALVSAERGSVILLEEPENNLHAGAQRLLSDWLRKHAVENHKQVLITTHSTIFALNEEHCSTYLVRLDPKEGTKVTKLEPGDEAAVKEELGLRNVDLYGCSMVVLCEGDSEMVAMPIVLNALARKAGRTLPALGVAWRNLGGSGNSRVKWVEEFLNLLQDIQVPPYILADDDPGLRQGLERLVRHGALTSSEYHLWTLDKGAMGRNASVSSEFEDNWTNEQLVDVASEMAQEDGIDLGLTVARLGELCKASRKRTSKVLNDYCSTEKQYDLKKRELNRRLALLVVEDIESNAERAVAQYQVARVAQDILVALGVLSEEDAHR